MLAKPIASRYGHADYLDALNRVVTACRAHGKAAGILVYDTAVVPRHLELGFSFVGIGSDGAFVAIEAKRSLAAVRG